MTDFCQLYERYAPHVFRFALYLAGNRAKAEDITSETFVRAWTTLQSLRTETVKAYLFTITRNLYLQGLRKDSRDVELDQGLPDTSAPPDARAAQREELQAVLQRIQRLPEPDRAALLMRAQEGLSYEEIARVLGLSLSAVKVKIHRARLALAQFRRTQEEPQ